MLILTQDISTTPIAALRLSEPARYDELMADVPDTLQLTYMGSMGSYEQMDFDLPAVSPAMYFSIDWDEPQSTAEIVVSKCQTNNDYTLPKLKYDPTAPGCATEDNFEEYVARKLLLPTKQKSKGEGRAASWQSMTPIADDSEVVFNLHPAIVAGIEPDEGLQRAGAQVANNLEILGSDNSPAVILSESELAESLMTGSPEYREVSRSLSKHDSDLTEGVTTGSAFDLNRGETIQQRLRNSSISSDVSFEIPIQYPSPLPDTEESWDIMTAVTTVCQHDQGTDGITRMPGGRPDIVRYIIRIESRSESSPSFLAEPSPISLLNSARELRYRNVGNASLIDITPHNPLKDSPHTSSRPENPWTWPRVPTASAIKLGPPAHMLRRKEPTAENLKSTVNKGIKKAVETLFTRRGINIDHGPRPRYLSDRRASMSSPSLSPKQVRSPTKAARVATKARKIRQWAKSSYCSNPPDSPQSCIAERAYEDGHYLSVTDLEPDPFSRLIYRSHDSTTRRSRAWTAVGATMPLEQIIPPPTTPPLAPKKAKRRNAFECERSPPPLPPWNPQWVGAWWRAERYRKA